jgi:hypothetical protein
MKNTMYNHSSIIHYPIDYNSFPNAKKCNFIELNLKAGQYLLIPKFWHHWVYTEPNTVALSFQLRNMGGDESHFLFNKVINNRPFVGKGVSYDFNYSEFINTLSDVEFNALYSDTIDCSPVFKSNNIYKATKNKLLKDILADNKKYYLYIGQNSIISNPSFPDFYKKIKNFIDIDKDEKQIHYEHNSNLWLTLNKPVNSGLHWDENDGILYVLSGAKKVRLAQPTDIKHLYYKIHDHI